MVPWTHWREPRLGRLLTEWTSEFTVFNLVIRLSKGKQSAFFRVSLVDVAVEQWAAVIGHSPFFGLCACTPWKPSFFQRCSRDRPLSYQLHDQVSGHACKYGISFFWFSWWGQQVVHPINELVSCLCPIWVDRPRSCNGNNVRPI